MTDPSGPPTNANTRTVSVSFDLNRLPSAITALGIGLMGAAIAVSATYSREHSELDGSNFIMGVLATVGLLAVAAGSHLLISDAERRASLVSLPGAAGIIGAGTMLAVLMDDNRGTGYAAAAVILALSIVGYAVTKAAAFVLTTIAGLAVLYIQVFDDVIDVDGDGGNSFMIIGAAILVFVGAVTAIGWLLPKTRVLSSVVVGVGAVMAFAALFQFMFIASAFESFSSESDSGFRISSEAPAPEYSGSYEQLRGEHMDEPYISDDGDYYPSESEYGDHQYRDDTKVILAFCVALGLFWALCSALTGHVAFRLLSIAILVFSIPATTVALTISHPTWWQVALTALGSLVLAAAGLRSLKASPPTTDQ